MSRPEPSEYVEYYYTYIKLVPDGDISTILEHQIKDTLELLKNLNEEQAMFSYAPDKWTLKQVIGHLIDGERMFSYRAMCFARNDLTPLPSFDQNFYVENSNTNARSLPNILDEFRLLRSANVTMFKSFDDEIMRRSGTASGFNFSVRAKAYIISGHELHHRNIIQEKYLV